MLLPLGLAYFGLYYATFRFVIRRFALPTPGREADGPEELAPVRESDRARAMVAALGGARNLVSVDACTTRLRLVVTDQAAVDEVGLRALGARGFVRPSANTLQVVLGPIADQVAGEMRDVMRSSGPALVQPSVPSVPPLQTPADGGHVDADLLSRLLIALGGRGNVAALDTASTRILVTLRKAGAVDLPALESLGLRGIARPAPTSLHLVVGPNAEATLRGLRSLIGG
jgi:N-acetylglucosamine PTS system EIICBA or EIICB component